MSQIVKVDSPAAIHPEIRLVTVNCSIDGAGHSLKSWSITLFPLPLEVGTGFNYTDESKNNPACMEQISCLPGVGLLKPIEDTMGTLVDLLSC